MLVSLLDMFACSIIQELIGYDVFNVIGSCLYSFDDIGTRDLMINCLSAFEFPVVEIRYKNSHKPARYHE